MTVLTPQRPDRTRRLKRTGRRLMHAALFAAVRGLAYAAGTGAGGALIWWITHR
ncbi:hypothetical protein [Actinomadura macrotermitis]|uniref:Uncharacterized protein n=1 Tax=Actinomadura macrotermitis TaxID=2585200 RepID=A0A7K0BQ74_9ACTN|nr:hypothetical protein [Actinomadura macrotermitis]MQY03287.1 hypothetical protein [Actinomadura macrotermitis]